MSPLMEWPSVEGHRSPSMSKPKVEDVLCIILGLWYGRMSR